MGDDALLVTTRRLVDLLGRVPVVPVDAAFGTEVRNRRRGTPTVLATGQTVFVGFNVGERGGGLQAIDRRSGRVSLIERLTNETDPCSGPLGTKCDPVTGLAVAPWNADCVVATVGMRHFFSHGRILEVCGARVRVLYQKAEGKQWKSATPDAPDPSLAFFGLASRGDGVWAVGGERLYRIERDQSVSSTRQPRLRRVGRFWLSFDHPDVVLVMTMINQRRSLSGWTPILVPRR